jgi:type I restriction enzyme S subunit
MIDQVFSIYRDSDSSWPVYPLGYLCTEVKKKNKLLFEENLLSLSYGRIKRKDIESTEGLLPESFDGYNIVESGDVVLRLTDLQNDKKSLRTGLVIEKGIITSAYTSIRPNKLEPRWLHYILHSYDIQKIFYSLGSGLRQSMKFDDLKSLAIAMPELEVQKELSDYLDFQLGKIDEFIAKRKEQLLINKELVQSIISSKIHADLPSKKLKHLAQVRVSNVDKHSLEDQENVQLCNYVDVYKNRYITSEIDFMHSTASFEQIRNFSLIKGDVLFTKDSETASDIASSALVTEDVDGLVLGYHCGLLRVFDVDANYLYWAMQTSYVQNQFAVAATGVTRVGLKLTDIGEVKIPHPGKGDQIKIASELNTSISKIEAFNSLALKQIEIAAELKKSLVTSVVSGNLAKITRKVVA